MSPLIVFGMAAAGMFSSVLAFLEIGRRIGVSRTSQEAEGASAGLGAVDGAVFGLMGLMIAFTFSGAGARFDARRQLIGAEANAIGTAYHRLDLLPPAAQQALREDFRGYLDARLGFYGNMNSDSSFAWSEQSRSEALQRKIWDQAVAGCKEIASPATTTLVLTSLNAMIDTTTTELVALQTHPPQPIYWGLLALVLLSALLAGYGMARAKKRSWVHMVIYSAVMAAAMYVTLDFEYPRLGLIRIDAADQILIDLRKSLK